MTELEKTTFDKEVLAYQQTPFYTKKSDGYKNGFKDALVLAWEIILNKKEVHCAKSCTL